MCKYNTNPAQVLGRARRLDLSCRSANVAFPLGLPCFSTILCTSGSLSAAGTWWPHAKLATITRCFDFGGYFATPVARGKLAASTTPRLIVITSLTFYTIFTSGLRVPACVARDIILLVPLLRTQGIVALKTLRKVCFSISFQLCQKRVVEVLRSKASSALST